MPQVALMLLRHCASQHASHTPALNEAAAWEQATLGTSLGGAAVLLATISSAASKCQELGPYYSLAWPAVTAAAAQYDLAVSDSDCFRSHRFQAKVSSLPPLTAQLSSLVGLC